MKILHLTDFHYTKNGPKSILKQNSLCKALIEQTKELEFDFIVFSGDLVNSGEISIWFSEAYEILIDPILTLKNIPSENVFFCQGNHDVDRSKIRLPFIKYIDEELLNSDDLDKFANYGNTDFVETLKPSKNYFEFLKGLSYPTSDILTDMYSVHIRELGGKKIGFVSLNTSWRSVGEDDENKLVYPPSYIYQALNDINGVDIKIILHHHPLNFLSTNNQYEVEDLIHNKFDISFFGHVHKGLTSIDYTPKTGIIKILSPASLKYHSGGDMGFSIVNFKLQDAKFDVSTYLYNLKQEFFYKAPSGSTYEIPTNDLVRKQNSFRAKLRKLIGKEKDSASELFVSFGENNFKFEDIFIEPLLRKQDYLSGKVDKLKPLEIRDLIYTKSDYIIAGDDKCGKTSLLKYIHIHILEEYEAVKQIPYFLDISIENSSFTLEVFRKRVKNYYEINLATTNEIFEEKGVILLIDNFDIGESWQNDFITDLKNTYGKSRIIITSPKHSELIMKPIRFAANAPKLIKFENLKNKQVRALANKWTGSNIKRREEIIVKINSLFKQLHIPFSFWNVSLFLWVVKKSGDKSIQNNVGLVDLYIESLLERENLIKTNAHFAYEKYLKLLAHIAHYLLVEHSKKVYSAPELEILNFIGDYLRQNPRNKSISPHSVWTYLKERGIFKKATEDRFSFRLNGVFEYFLAYYMKLNPKFRDEAIKDELFFLSFKNEFEIYAGFSRDDTEFLNNILTRTKQCLAPINQRYDGMTLDSLLRTRAKILPNYERKLIELSNKAKSLSFEEQEEIELLANELDIDTDTIEGVREKKPLSLNQDEIGLAEDSLFILGRVFRNMDEINSEKTVKEIFQYYVKSVCQWGLSIIDTSKALDFQTNYESEDNIELLYNLMSTTVPLIVQMTASDHINQRNLEGIILDRINLLIAENRGSENQFELFVLYLFLVDLDLFSNKKYLLELLKHINLPVLKNAILLKLNNYLAFKTNEDVSLEKFLRNLIQKERLKLNNKLDAGDIQKELETQKKQNLIGK